jgi:uncharacterized OB-fold protein
VTGRSPSSGEAPALGFPLPDVTAHEFAGFWAGCAEQRLLIRRCTTCEAPSWPPRPLCPFCGSDAVCWSEVEPAGKLFSWTVVHRTPLPAFAPLTPYAVAVVELDRAQGVRVLARMHDSTRLSDLRIGLSLTAIFEQFYDLMIPIWRTVNT